MCFLVGLSFPFCVLIFCLVNPPTSFIDFCRFLIELFYINVPELILFIGGVTSLIELDVELRKNKLSQE